MSVIRVFFILCSTQMGVCDACIRRGAKGPFQSPVDVHAQQVVTRPSYITT